MWGNLEVISLEVLSSSGLWIWFLIVIFFLGFVLFQESVVDVNKLISQLERSEKTRVETETRMVTLKTDNQRLQDKYDRSNSTIKRLNSEVKDYREKLRSTEDTLGRISVSTIVYFCKIYNINNTTGLKYFQRYNA